MRYYLLRLLRMRAFQRAPVTLILRAIHLAFLILTGGGKIIHVRFGSSVFKFQYVHGQKFGGGRGIFLNRGQVEDLMEFGDQFLKRGNVVIDGGANQGVFTTAFANYVGPDGHVIAVEPMPYAVDHIKNNCRINDLSNVTVFQNALSDREADVTLDFSRGVGAASITNDYGGADTIDVTTATIDAIVAECGVDKVDFIKLDIEGAELLALHGARDTIAQSRPVICLEISSYGADGADRAAHEFLLEQGYAAFEFKAARLEPFGAMNPPHPNVFYIPETRAA